MTDDRIRLREEVAEQIKSLKDIKIMGEYYGLDLSCLLYTSRFPATFRRRFSPLVSPDRTLPDACFPSIVDIMENLFIFNENACFSPLGNRLSAISAPNEFMHSIQMCIRDSLVYLISIQSVPHLHRERTFIVFRRGVSLRGSHRLFHIQRTVCLVAVGERNVCGRP